jgi:N-acetylglutamate synthase-like GNAT family acetyltransferase
MGAKMIESHVRVATMNDLSLVKMLHDKYNNFLGYFSTAAARRMTECGQVFIAEHNGEACGYVAFRTGIRSQTNVAAIYQAAVHWDVTRIGHGVDLLAAVAATALADKCDTVQLWCRENDPGHFFWPACGMTSVAQRCGSQTARGRDCHLWRIGLTHQAVDQITKIVLPRKPITPSGKWAKLNEPETHAKITKRFIARVDYAAQHKQIDVKALLCTFNVPPDPNSLRSDSK